MELLLRLGAHKRLPHGILCLLMLLLLPAGPSTVRAQDTSPRLRTAPIGLPPAWSLPPYAEGDTIEIVAHRLRPLLHRPLPSLSNYLKTPTPLRDRARAFFVMTHPRTYERPLLERAIFGADRLGGSAAALGGLGLVGGLWKDKTVWYMMGAGSLAGALWGSTLGADNPGIRIGIEPEPFMYRHSSNRGHPFIEP